jgi:hypothetical protein
MENLPDELVRQIIRATDEDTSDIEDEAGAASQRLHRLARAMRQPWVVHVRGTDQDASEQAELWRRVLQNGAVVDSLRIELHGDTLSLPTIPAPVRAAVRKLSIVNVGSVSRQPLVRFRPGDSEQEIRAEVPLPSHLFNPMEWPTLRKLIAPGHALPRNSSTGHPGIRTLECYFAYTGQPSDKQMRDNMIACCPNLERLRWHTARFHYDIRFPSTVRRLWWRVDDLTLHPSSIDAWFIGYFLFTLTQDHGLALEEIMFANISIYGSGPLVYQRQLDVLKIRRLAFIDCHFDSKVLYDTIIKSFGPSLERVVVRHVTWDTPEPGMDDMENPRPTKRPRYEALVRVLADLIRCGGLELDAARAAVFKTHWERVLSL